jgi:hypothetical protein
MSDSSTSTEVMVLDSLQGLADIGAKAPALFLKEAGAAERFFDFFTANIQNTHTRRAYYNAACRFSEFCVQRGVYDLGDPRAAIHNTPTPDPAHWYGHMFVAKDVALSTHGLKPLSGGGLP